ncbi:hypothetical protein GEU84_019190 [Fertoebacter nigrum]|uniref:Uncharacterized protein n=1 Tax=Fertoeibacter niger TaxID=2656921 RepID=A0A8X8H6C1_9RHOB|nr:hypothetical protein [Fertoeibacter niger]NUB46523.1 hypothetical protein [Fertoeibacter niger]
MPEAAKRRRAGAVRESAGLLALCLLLPGCLPETHSTAQERRDMAAGMTDEGRAVRSDELPAPRLTGAASERLIYDQARGQNSNAALIMFLARNPASPHAPDARLHLTLRTTPDAPGIAQAVAGADADVVSAFDAARLAAGSGPLRAFLDRHAGHPLAAEAARLLAAR